MPASCFMIYDTDTSRNATGGEAGGADCEVCETRDSFRLLCRSALAVCQVWPGLLLSSSLSNVCAIFHTRKYYICRYMMMTP